MDAEPVQTLPYLPGKMHVACRAGAFDVAVDLNVEAGDDFGVAELPDVEVVTAEDAGEFFDIGFDVVDVKADGDGLEENTAGGFTERDGAGEDDDGDEEGDARVDVVAPAVGGEPDKERAGDDADVAECIAHDMQEDSSHVKISVGMSVTFASFSSRPCMIMIDVPGVVTVLLFTLVSCVCT